MNYPVYLDNNATTPIDPRVVETMVTVLREHFGNAASSTHPFGWHAAELVNIARERTAALIRCRPDEIVFTSGATESINTVLFSMAKHGRIVSAATEHRATLDPLEQLRLDGADVEIVPVRSDGSLDLAVLDAACRPGTALVSLMLANNEIGTIHPIARISAMLAPRGIALHCDAAQAAGKLPLDVAALGVTFLSLSAHKMYGPKGAGALFVKSGSRSLLRPLIFGGGHEGGLRSGTTNVAAIAGMGHAAELADGEQERDVEQLAALARRLWSAIQAGIPGAKLNGPLEGRLPGNLNFTLPGVENAQLVGQIQTKVALSVSSACQSAAKTPSHVLQAIGLTQAEQRSSVRIGIGRFNTVEEIDYAAGMLIEKARK